MSVTIINMQRREGGCCNCGKPVDGAYGLPVFEGHVVANDWPGEWGGQDCCQDCYELPQRDALPGTLPAATWWEWYGEDYSI